HITSISFTAGSFDVNNVGSQSFVYIDYANGPASRSINQNITALWEFRAGASFSNDVEFHNNTGNIFAIFSSTSLGRFGIGDSTPEAYFEIASSSGITASISNTFYVDALNKRVGINTSTPAVALDISGSASVSSNFEAIGYASASSYFGGGLTS